MIRSASAVAACTILWIVTAPVHPAADTATCAADSAEKQLLWGDLHAHTAWSLDAYAFGTVATPADAFAFARGQELRLANGDHVRIDRPLDFVAVTDHAETFDVMYLCTDPLYAERPYCRTMRDARQARRGREIFTDYLLPIVAQSESPAVCGESGVDCAASSLGQWRRVQAAANAANDPCRFTAFIGYEWSASPGGRHWHRNVVFRSDQVPDQAFDYLRYPEPQALWAALDANCVPAEGCDVMAIPHNINWADGGGFDIGAESGATRALRSRFERLAEIHQEKGNSECLSADPEDRSDCDFEILTANFARDHVSGADARSAEEAWQQTRSTYYRSLLTRGLLAYDASGRAANPLMLGAIGSTDNHLGTPGRVAERGYWGSMSMLWQEDEARLTSTGYNPGGLVAVWAPGNTRADVFDALKRREAYATSGPRISLRFDAVSTAGSGSDACDAATAGDIEATMGGTLPRLTSPPTLRIIAGMDEAPLARAEIVKVSVRSGAVTESVHVVATFENGAASTCRGWQDADFDPDAPAFYYARVVEQPTPRWSRHLCKQLGRCDAHPQADQWVQERAWSSPIWYEPGTTN